MNFHILQAEQQTSSDKKVIEKVILLELFQQLNSEVCNWIGHLLSHWDYFSIWSDKKSLIIVS